MKPPCRLGLGTVQWGLAYGLANRDGVTPLREVKAILAEAESNGVRVLDTASLYGNAEAVLGANPLQAFKVITKTPAFGTPAISDGQVRQLVDTFGESLAKLSSGKLYGLLLHSANDLLAADGEKLADAMRDLKDAGSVEKIGVSIYDADQLAAALKVFKPDIVQLPVSVLDQRLLRDGSLQRLKDSGIEVHARSVFLQGLLLMPMAKVPAYFNPIRDLLERWRAAAEMQGLSPGRAALSFVRDIPFLDAVLVGVENLDQYRQCFVDFSAGDTFDASDLACGDRDFVNPSRWKIA